MTPFTDIILKIESKVRSRSADTVADPLLVMCWAQLRLLDTTYRSMSEYDILSNIEQLATNEYDYASHEYRSSKSILDYFTFINILNQFGRVLKLRTGNRIEIPKFNRIRFFRNKVSEHWEEYSGAGFVGSQMQQKGEIAIPSINATYSPEERKLIKQQVDTILESFGLSLELTSPEVSNSVDIDGNADKVFEALESIDPTLNGRKKHSYIIPDELITLLFKFGFPVPISNVRQYCEELVGYLIKNLLIE